MSKVRRHPAWPNSKSSLGGFTRQVERREGRLVDTPTVRAMEEFYGISNLERWLTHAYYGRALTYAEIADELGCHQSTVGHWMRDMGMTMRQVAFTTMAELVEQVLNAEES